MADIWDQAAAAAADTSAPAPSGDIWDQAAASPSAPEAQTTPGQQDHSWLGELGNTFSNWWKQVNPGAQLQGAANLAAHPINAIQNYAAQNSQIAQKVEDSFKKGNYLEGGRHVLNYLLNTAPGLGATSDAAGDQLQSGDISGGIGTTAGLGTNLALGIKAPEIAQGASALARGAAGAVGKGAAEVVGKTTGVGAKPFEMAAANPSNDLVSEMRSPDEMSMVSNMRDAVANVKSDRALAYQNDLTKLSAQGQPSVDPTPILAARDQQLQNFRVDKVPNPPAQMTGSQYQQWQNRYGGMQPGDLDFSRSPISDAGQADIAKASNLIDGWQDWSPVGADALKRRLDDLWSPSGQARSLITNLRNQVKNQIVQQVPAYAKMTQGYADASRFLDQLSDLSLNSKNPGTAIRKLTTTLNQNNTYRQMLVDELSKYSNIDLPGQLAGNALSRLAPRGIMGPGSGMGILYAIMRGYVSPDAALAFALTSPRLMGELAVALGKTRPFIQQAAGAATAAAPIAARAAIAAGQATRTNSPEQ